MTAVQVVRRPPGSPVARAMAAALWAEIQARYGFQAPDPFDPSDFVGTGSGFWVALLDEVPVGSIALARPHGPVAELHVMYVAPAHRRTGASRALLTALEEHAAATGTATLRLRAGDPQPEALAFYAAVGFRPTEPFGRWVGDPTARCFEKALGPAPRDR